MPFKWTVPLSDLDYGAPERAAVLRVLKSRWLTMGPEVEAFEKEFARATGAKHAVAVSNATAGLRLCLLALGAGKGDEVLQPALNFVASANATRTVGAEPVFADILSLEEPTVDPAELEARVTAKTKIVVAMHYGGRPCRMAEIAALCRRKKLALIEDACHAVGASYKGRPVGVLGDAACFSFFGNKNMATGEGGMVTTDRDDVAEKVRRLRSHGMTTLTWDRHRGHASRYDVTDHGYNDRLDELHAALGRAQLKKLPGNNRRRARWAALYLRRLKNLSGWSVPFAGMPGDSAHHLMVVLAPDEAARDAAAAAFKEARVQTSLHYPCVADFTAFRGRSSGGLAKTRDFARRALTLPLFPTMTAAQVEAVCRVLRRAGA